MKTISRTQKRGSWPVIAVISLCQRLFPFNAISTTLTTHGIMAIVMKWADFGKRRNRVLPSTVIWEKGWMRLCVARESGTAPPPEAQSLLWEPLETQIEEETVGCRDLESIQWENHWDIWYEYNNTWCWAPSSTGVPSPTIQTVAHERHWGDLRWSSTTLSSASASHCWHWRDSPKAGWAGLSISVIRGTSSSGAVWQPRKKRCGCWLTKSWPYWIRSR